MTPTPKLRARGLTKRYGDFVALAPTDLEVSSTIAAPATGR